ncbi:hydrolase [Brevibacterium litoralis]|uniref:hydrolase n=1 Tax=Brevibacterium litoralis TaxID=3138935 RepID=UPI0032F0184F
MHHTDGSTGRVLQCRTCGVEYPAAALPDVCPICADERQYLRPDGRQLWADPDDFDGDVSLHEVEPGVWRIDTSGAPGIGQRAYLLVSGSGNVMIDVPGAFHPAAVATIHDLGGIQAIIASHPHMYAVQSLWSAAFDDAPVYVSAPDEHWLAVRPTRCLVWDDEVELVPGVVASQPGGHFPGSTAVHWAGEDGAGVLFTGDTIGVNRDGETLAFMWSYPNRIPLSAAVAERIAGHVSRHDFARLYDNFGGTIATDARARVRTSAARHASWARGDHDHLTGGSHSLPHSRRGARHPHM